MKKPSVISFLITLLLAAVVCSHGQETVKDASGNPRETGQLYYIQPLNFWSNNGGGLVPVPIAFFRICPLGIAQTLLPYQTGLPLSIRYADSSSLSEKVKTSPDVNIQFEYNIWPYCTELSKLWAVDIYSSAIFVGGKKESKYSRFKIEKTTDGENTYKLTSLERTVGATRGSWLACPQLYLTNTDDLARTLVVKFNKVNNSTTATTSTSRVEKLGLKMFPFY